MEQYRTYGKILRGLGGRYDIRLCSASAHAAACAASAAPDALTPASPLAGQLVFCRARGKFRYLRENPLIGDDVTVTYTAASFTAAEDGTAAPDPHGTDVVISAILPRRTALIRPPMANLDMLFVTMACAAPEPIPQMTDKLLCIAEYHGIRPVVLLTKSELDPARAAELEEIYTLAGFPVFTLGHRGERGADALRGYLRDHLRPGEIAAFAGASGVGKSTLISAIFPDLKLETGAVSEKTARGRHTTRCVTLYPTGEGEDAPYLADTPGFSALDFEQFDFFGKDDLPGTMRDFAPYLGQCRYTNCSHISESDRDCAVIRALHEGKIAPSRHESYRALYDVLKLKKDWERRG